MEDKFLQNYEKMDYCSTVEWFETNVDERNPKNYYIQNSDSIKLYVCKSSSSQQRFAGIFF